MSQTPKPHENAQTALANSADKAEILRAILGQEKLDALRKKGLDLSLAEGAGLGGSDAKSTAEQLARQLIARLSEKKSRPVQNQAPKPVQKTTAQVEQPRTPKQQPAAPKVIERPDPALVLARVAQYVTPQTMPNEHPAVIAHVISKQAPKTRHAVLRALSGPKARAVARYLRKLQDEPPKNI